MSTIKTPKELFGSKGSLIHDLYKTSENLTKLQKILLKYLPEQAHISGYQSGLLNLVCEDAMLGSYIRYHQDQLIADLATETLFRDLKSIRITVRPTPPAPSFTAKGTRDKPDDLSATMDGDKRLDDALNNISVYIKQ
ncbi:MAG: hypothetical protein OEZ23_00455, partial [Gammaproteobacteria bacterium]|nr:hypothetical protein [Gammaproteobacteria bacterium]